MELGSLDGGCQGKQANLQRQAMLGILTRPFDTRRDDHATKGMKTHEERDLQVKLGGKMCEENL